MKLWIDDSISMPDNYDFHARTSMEAIDIIKNNKITEISFDYDLGGHQQNGFWVAKWIEFLAYHKKIDPLKWEIHSKDKFGKEVIESAMKNAENFWSKNDKLNKTNIEKKEIESENKNNKKFWSKSKNEKSNKTNM
jgi:hypothetical protein